VDHVLSEHLGRAVTQDEIKAHVCEEIAKGRSLRDICAADGFPAPSTICLWLKNDAAFAEHYAHARERQADHFADEIIEIADKATAANYNVARLKVDARKWKASKLAPKKYGDKLDLNHSGGLKVETVKRVIHDPRDTDSAGIQPTA
jgi:hypothetical protein